MMLKLFMISMQAAFHGTNDYRVLLLYRVKKDNIGVLAPTRGMFTHDAVHVPGMFETASGTANSDTDPARHPETLFAMLCMAICGCRGRTSVGR
jgi:hypothetical protein